MHLLQKYPIQDPSIRDSIGALFIVRAVATMQTNSIEVPPHLNQDELWV